MAASFCENYGYSHFEIRSLSAQTFDCGKYGKGFDCGKYGKGFVSIDGDVLGFQCNMKHLNELTEQSTVAYHLHTIWLNDCSYSTDTCGSDYTGLHYDPTFKCGGASEARDDVECEDVEYMCDSFETCEVGDLSGKYGKLELENGRAKKNVGGDTAPALVEHYLEDNGNRDPALFSSIVFHEGVGGARILCCSISELN